MTWTALLLVIVAAVLHATWNLAAKRARSGLPFVVNINLVIAALYLPVVITYVAVWKPVIPWSAAWIVVVSGLLKACYALFLQRAYACGDFSLVYPLARGTGPLLGTAGAIVLLGERPTGLALLGAAIIVGSVFVIATGPRGAPARGGRVGAGVLYGLGTGGFIALYTVWDAHGVAGRGIPPVLFDAGTGWVILLVLAQPAWKRRGEVAAVWRSNRREILTVALLSPVAYVLVLTAMTFSPVSYIAPAREMSMLFGTLLGARVLREENMTRRMLGAAGMLAGVVLLALN